MSKRYSKMLKRHPMEMLTLHILLLIVIVFSLWLPAFFVGAITP